MHLSIHPGRILNVKCVFVHGDILRWQHILQDVNAMAVSLLYLLSCLFLMGISVQAITVPGTNTVIQTN